MSYWVDKQLIVQIEPLLNQLEHAVSFQQVTKLLLQLAAYLPELPEDLKIAKNEIEGCETQTWLAYCKTDDNISLYAASSASRIMRGLLLLLIAQQLQKEIKFTVLLSDSKQQAFYRLQKAIFNYAQS